MSSMKKTGWGGPRPGSGRKPKPVEEHRRNLIVLRLDDAEYEALRKAAKGGSLSGLARDVLLRYLARLRC
jgi:hypothetical protein